jgi:hypothetical protein
VWVCAVITIWTELMRVDSGGVCTGDDAVRSPASPATSVSSQQQYTNSGHSPARSEGSASGAALSAAAAVTLRYAPLRIPLTLLLRPQPLAHELFFQQWETCVPPNKTRMTRLTRRCAGSGSNVRRNCIVINVCCSSLAEI